MHEGMIRHNARLVPCETAFQTWYTPGCRNNMIHPHSCMSFMYTLSSSSSSVLYTHIHIFSEYKTFSTIASLSLFYLFFLEDKT